MSPDPILTSAVRSMVAAQQNATKAGASLAPADLDAYIKEETQGKYGLSDAQKLIGGIDTSVNFRNVGRSLGQGALFNWGDELLKMLPESMGGGKAGQEDMRLRQELFHNAHPYVDTGANIVGGVLPTLLAPEAEVALGGKALGEMSLGAKALRGAATGAVEGGLAGAGAGESGSSRVTNAAVGGAGGAALGALIPSVISGVNSLRNPVTKAAKRIAYAVDKSGGADAVSAAADKMAANGRGDVATLADMSQPLRNATDFSANNSDDALTQIADMAKQRRLNSPARVLNDVKQGVGPVNAVERGDKLSSDLSTWAAGPEGYGGIRDADPVIDTAPFAARLNKPGVVSAWNLARRAGDITAGDPLDQLFTQLQQKNPGVSREALLAGAKSGVLGDDVAKMAAQGGDRPVTFDDVHSFRQILDDKIEHAFQVQKNGNLGNALKTVRDEVQGALSDAVPNIKDIDAKYAQGMNLQRALEQGKDDFHIDDPDELAKTVKNLSPGALEQYRYGMASELVNQMKNAQTNRNLAASLMNRSSTLEDKLQQVFGTKANFDTFISRVSSEHELGKIEQTFGNSATARRLQARGFDPAEVGVNAAITGAMHGPAGLAKMAAHMAAKNTTNAIQRNTAREMAPMLMTQGTPEIKALLAKLPQLQQGPVGRVGTYGLPTLAARGISSLFDQ